MDKKPNEPHENLILTKINNHKPYSINSCRTITQTYISYNWPAFLAASYLNSVYTPSYVLIRIRY